MIVLPELSVKLPGSGVPKVPKSKVALEPFKLHRSAYADGTGIDDMGYLIV